MIDRTCASRYISWSCVSVGACCEAFILHPCDCQPTVDYVMNALRDTPIGQVLRLTGLKRQLLFPEELEGSHPAAATHFTGEVENQKSPTREEHAKALAPAAQHELDVRLGSGLDPSKISTNEGEQDALLVDWDGPKDPANPKNWSSRKKAWVVVVIWHEAQLDRSLPY